MSAVKVQPKLSLRFSSPLPAWNGDVSYKTASKLAQAARNVPDVVPAHVLAKTKVTIREAGRDPELLDAWLARDRRAK